MTSRATPAVCAAALAAALASPALLDAQCEDPDEPQVIFAAPFIDGMARVAAGVYWTSLPADPKDSDKDKAADVAITRALQYWQLVIPNAVADGLQPRVDENLETAQRIVARVGEVARTDMEDGASSSVSGASSVANETGLASILSWAVEHGAVQREHNGTSTTFSTTPYAFLLLLEEDSDDTFNDYRVLRRLGLAGTFDLDESSSDGSGDFNADKLSALTTSVRLLGDRSPRSRDFFELWNDRVAEPMRENAREEAKLLTTTLQPDDPFLAPLKTLVAAGPAPGPVRIVLRDTLVRSSNREDSIRALDRALRTEVCARIVRPIQTGAIDVSGIPRAAAIEAATRGLQTLEQAQQQLESVQEEFNARPVITFKHTWNRSDEGTDFSDFILAADGEFRTLPYTSVPIPLAPLTVLFNASFSINHDPDGSRGQDEVRDYGITGSLERAMPNPLRLGTRAESAQRMALSLTGRFARQEDEDANIGVVQGRLTIPLVRGFSFAVALNYNTRTETDSNDEVRLSGNIEFNGDKFASLSALQSLLTGEQL
jgi:hypothetical protein